MFDKLSFGNKEEIINSINEAVAGLLLQRGEPADVNITQAKRGGHS